MAFLEMREILEAAVIHANFRGTSFFSNATPNIAGGVACGVQGDKTMEESSSKVVAWERAES